MVHRRPLVIGRLTATRRREKPMRHRLAPGHWSLGRSDVAFGAARHAPQTAAPAPSAEALAVAKGIGDHHAPCRPVQGADAGDPEEPQARDRRGRSDVEQRLRRPDAGAAQTASRRGSTNCRTPIAIVYANNFTPDDLRGLITFYKSPVRPETAREDTGLVTQQSLLAGPEVRRSRWPWSCSSGSSRNCARRVTTSDAMFGLPGCSGSCTCRRGPPSPARGGSAPVTFRRVSRTASNQG